MSSAKTMIYAIKNLFAILIALFVFATLTLHAQEKKDTRKCGMAKWENDDSGKCSSACESNMKASKTKLTSGGTKPFNAVCPVKGNKIDAKVKTVEYKGKVYGFCCPGCDEKFKSDPEKYSKQLSDDGKTFAKK